MDVPGFGCRIDRLVADFGSASSSGDTGSSVRRGWIWLIAASIAVVVLGTIWVGLSVRGRNRR